jgi:hypothetical protein
MVRTGLVMPTAVWLFVAAPRLDSGLNVTLVERKSDLDEKVWMQRVDDSANDTRTLGIATLGPLCV